MRVLYSFSPCRRLLLYRLRQPGALQPDALQRPAGEINHKDLRLLALHGEGSKREHMRLTQARRKKREENTHLCVEVFTFAFAKCSERETEIMVRRLEVVRRPKLSCTDPIRLQISIF